MTEWLRLKSVQFDVVVSPYEVPEAVRGFKTSHGSFRVEFRYIDGEEPSQPPESIDKHIKVFRGRITHRLLAIEVDVDAIGAGSVGVTISTIPREQRTAQLKRKLEEVLRRLVEQHSEDAERRALESTREALKSRESDLLNQLAGA